MDKIIRNLFMRIDKWTKLYGIYLCESINGQIMQILFMRIDKWTKLYGIYSCDSINGQNYAEFIYANR